MIKTFIIAEAGVNHNGSIDIAYKLIDAAKDAGADAVKFQSFKADKLAKKTTAKAEYQKQTTDKSESQHEMLKKLELSEDDHKNLLDYCNEKQIMFLSTPFDAESLSFLNDLSIPIIKISSGDIDNIPFLRKIGALGKEVIFSSGISTIEEIDLALKTLISSGTKKENITVLHCNSEYPTPFEDVNLKAMQTIKNTFNVKVGYSDHTKGIEVSVAAVALGAEVIEKHFTLDNTLEGADHKASLEPHELKNLVSSIRNIEKAIGSGVKEPSLSEIKNKFLARKSIIASHDIKKGELFSENNITIKRPGNGLSPIFWDSVIGKIATKDYNEEDFIEL